LAAEINVTHVIVEYGVVKHIVGCLAHVKYVISKMGRLNAVSHILVKYRSGHVIIATDPAYTARDKVRITGIDASHKDVKSTKDHGSAVALLYLPVGEIDLAMNPQTTYNACNWVPRHFFYNDVGFILRDIWSG
jgi:hypothetical protein